MDFPTVFSLCTSVKIEGTPIYWNSMTAFLTIKKILDGSTVRYLKITIVVSSHIQRLLEL